MAEGRNTRFQKYVEFFDWAFLDQAPHTHMGRENRERLILPHRSELFEETIAAMHG